MAKFLRFIGFMVLALALWQTVSDTFANKAASGGNVVSENTIAVHEQTDAYIAMPHLSYKWWWIFQHHLCKKNKS